METLVQWLEGKALKYEVLSRPSDSQIDELPSDQNLYPNHPVLKNLFLVDKKKRCYLFSTLSNSKIPLRSISTLIKVPNLRLGDAELVNTILGVKAAALSPQAILNDKSSKVSLVFDKSIDQTTKIYTASNDGTTLIGLCAKDFINFFEEKNIDILWVDSSAPEAAEIKNTDSEVSAASKTDDTKTHLGIQVKKNVNFPEWYTQVIVKAELIDYYNVSGCYIIRPWGFRMWENIQKFMNCHFEKKGVQNSYFPMFVTKDKLETEQQHVDGFCAEVAWVTKYGTTDLAEPIAIRPTSETIMYPAFSRWIRSYRDLPLLINQWCPVVRWEFKQPTPFIRTREFLWQEGHTAHATDEEAEKLTFEMLDIYEKTYKDLLAIPVVKGVKSEGEKFAGAKLTSTVEIYVPQSGRGLQGGTSHHLGTNFSTMFDVLYENKDKKRVPVHQTSWGFATRSIGAMIMLHGDDKGLVLPPAVAPKQIVIIPILYHEGVQEIYEMCERIYKELQNHDFRVEYDDRDNYTPGWKFNYWEMKGIPLRLEVGMNDIKKHAVRLVRRDTYEKINVPMDELCKSITDMLTAIQETMYNRAKMELDNGIVKVTEFDEVMPALNRGKLILAPWCGTTESEDAIKKETHRLSIEHFQNSGGKPGMEDEQSLMATGAMKPLCFPLDQPANVEGLKCFFTGQEVEKWCLFGRSY